MTNQKYIKPVAGFSLAIIIVAQLATVFTGILIPKPVDAFFPGLPTPTIKIGDVYQVLKDIGLGALRQVALQASNKFLTRLTAKLQDKYKVRNYLYYDQVLTSYYLNNYISDKIDDPDLREIYSLMSAGFVTGQNTGTNNAPDRRKALIPRLKIAISNYYINHGGIDPNNIYYPAVGISDREYFAMAQAYFYNPPSFTEQNLQGQFGAFQSAATTAAQLEIIVGNGLKAGRIVGGTCSTPQIQGPPEPAPIQGPPAPSSFQPGIMQKLGLISVVYADEPPESHLLEIPTATNPNFRPQPTTGPSVPGSGNLNDARAEAALQTPAGCEASGGTWQPSALDKARSFIDNPTAAVAGWLDGAIKQKISGNFDPNSFWAVIGSLVGSFIFNQLALDKPQGILNEDPNYEYDPDVGVPGGEEGGSGTPIDLDGDGTDDGYDINGDGSPDVCVYGGVDDGSDQANPGPPCKSSGEALTLPDPPPPCTLELDINSSVTVPTDPDPTAPGSGTGSSSGDASVTCGGDSPPSP